MKGVAPRVRRYGAGVRRRKIPYRQHHDRTLPSRCQGPAADCGHRHRARLLAGPGAGRYLGRHGRGPFRHPRHRALFHRRPAHPHRRHRRLPGHRPHGGTPALSQRFAASRRATRPIAQSGIGTPRRLSPEPCSSPCPRSRSSGRSAEALAEASGQDGPIDLCRPACVPPRARRFDAWHDLFIFGTVADHIADRFGTKGSPISLSTACSSGATAIQLGVEAIRRGEVTLPHSASAPTAR